MNKAPIPLKIDIYSQTPKRITWDVYCSPRPEAALSVPVFSEG
jgi:hypothetical protein